MHQWAETEADEHTTAVALEEIADFHLVEFDGIRQQQLSLGFQESALAENENDNEATSHPSIEDDNLVGGFDIHYLLTDY